jgi:hypothetical protein
MKDKEGTEIEIKFLDCNCSPKLLTELQEKLKQWYDHIQKKMDRKLKDRASELL